MNVWINGRFIDRDEARISVFDAGFQHAVGVFETMLARHGRIFRPDHHLRRLIDSAGELRLSERLQPRPLAEALQQTVERNGLEAARVRLTVTGGDLNLLQSRRQGPVDPTIVIVAQPPTAYPDAFFEQGVRVVIADGRENPFVATAGHKTLSYWPRISALQAAAAKRSGEALWFTVTNHLAGGSVSNAFLVSRGRLLTPIARGEEEQGALPSAVLPGITRATVIELAEAEGIEVQRAMLDIEQLLAAEEVFLTNSSWGVLPVIGVERETIGTGAVGVITRMLRERWNEQVERETTGA
ncbi:MAG: aminotransferase class IV [Planctomycetota bacterium]|jgi:branched-subunit amino acid aminotransferase/4-amino-4-deoxychorismate lyase